MADWQYTPTRFMLPTSHYDPARADHAVAFIQRLCHTKGVWAGEPFILFPWQEQIIRDLFGIMKENGYRQFNTAFVEICKKAGKSELAAAIALYMLCADGEEGAEIYGCANDRQQSGIVFGVAADMARQSPALMRRVKIVESQKRIVYYPTRSTYQALSSDVASKYGYNVHACIFDELLGQPNGNVLVDHDTLAYAAICVDRVIEIPEVPEGVLAMKWCCVDGEFSLNPNYIEPEEPTDWDYALQILNGEADYDGE